MLLVGWVLGCSVAKVDLGEERPADESAELNLDSGSSDSGQPHDDSDAHPTEETGDSQTTDTADTGDVVAVSIAVELVDPAAGSTEGGEAVTIYGGPFRADAVVTFASASATVLSWTESTLAVVTPPGSPGLVDVTVTTEAGSGGASGVYTYVEPCAGVVASPSSVRTGNDDDEDVSITLTGCATGIVGVGETYVGYDGTTYGVTWTSVPTSVDGTGTATLRLLHWSRFTPSSSYYPYLQTDQGRVTIEVDPT